MAKKRMFRLDVLETDAFMDMPLTTQALYFHLNLRADDDGFVGNPKMITRNIGASMDDLKLLITKRFVLLFEDGVIVIKHWRLHNNLTSSRYTETKYLEDKARLFLKDNGSYSENEGNLIDDTHYIETGKRQTKQRRDIDETKTTLDKSSVDKNSIDKSSSVVAPTPIDQQLDQIMSAWNEIPHTVKIKSIVPMTQRYDELRVVLSMVGMDGVMEAIQRVKESDYLSQRGHVVFDRYMNRNAIQGLLEGAYDEDYSTDKTGGTDYGLARDW